MKRTSATSHAAYLQAIEAAVPPEARRVFADYAQALLERDLPVLFSIDHLAFTCGVPVPDLEAIAWRPASHYSSFRIAKQRGGSRRIDAPFRTLKHVQRWIQRHVTAQMPVADAAHGFRKGRSIGTNAEPHVGKSIVLKYDLVDFFGSVSREQVHSCFQGLGYSNDVTRVLADLCVLRDALPQGAPTSPDLANAAAVHLDRRLEAVALSFELRYTRYADDLTFSGEAVREPKTRRTIEAIIRDSGFKSNDRKRQFLSQSTRQRVTGVVVNEKLNWPRDLRRWLRQELHFLETRGVEAHLAYKRERGFVHPRYREHIYGHALALHVIRPDEGARILERLDDVDWPQQRT